MGKNQRYYFMTLFRGVQLPISKKFGRFPRKVLYTATIFSANGSGSPQSPFYILNDFSPNCTKIPVSGGISMKKTRGITGKSIAKLLHKLPENGKICL